MTVRGALEFRFAVLVLCSVFDGSETSGHRTRKRNIKVGGAANSRHLRGLAMDVVLDNKRANGKPFVAACKALGIKVLDEKDHFHLSVAS